MVAAVHVLAIFNEAILKQMTQGFRVHTGPLITHPHAQHAATFPFHGEIHVQADLTPLTEFDGVAEQIIEHLHQTFAIAADALGQHAVNHAGEFQPGGLGHGAKGFQRLLDRRTEIEIIRIEGNATGKDAGIIQHVINQ